MNDRRFLAELTYPNGEEFRVIVDPPVDIPAGAKQLVDEFLDGLTETEQEQIVVIAIERILDLRGYHRECERRGLLAL